MPGPREEKRAYEPSETGTRTRAARQSARTNPTMGNRGKLDRHVAAGGNGRPGIRKTAERTQCQFQDCPVNLMASRPNPLCSLELGVTSVALDLNGAVGLSPFPPLTTRKGMAHAHRSLCLLPTDGLPAQGPVRPIRRAVSRQSTDSQLLLSRPIPVHGLRSIDLSREPAGHRDLSASDLPEALPCRLPRFDRSEHAGQGQRATRLAHLR